MTDDNWDDVLYMTKNDVMCCTWQRTMSWKQSELEICQSSRSFHTMSTYSHAFACCITKHAMWQATWWRTWSRPCINTEGLQAEPARWFLDQHVTSQWCELFQSRLSTFFKPFHWRIIERGRHSWQFSNEMTCCIWQQRMSRMAKWVGNSSNNKKLPHNVQVLTYLCPSHC